MSMVPRKLVDNAKLECESFFLCFFYGIDVLAWELRSLLSKRMAVIFITCRMYKRMLMTLGSLSATQIRKYSHKKTIAHNSEKI